jgi:hypothetical protein
VVVARDNLCDVRQTRDIDRRFVLSKTANAKLTGGVCSPALHAPSRHHRARVVTTGSDRLSAAFKSSRAHDERARKSAGASVTELTVRIPTPTLDASTFGQRASVVIACGEAGCSRRDGRARPWVEAVVGSRDRPERDRSSDCEDD